MRITSPARRLRHEHDRPAMPDDVERAPSAHSTAARDPARPGTRGRERPPSGGDDASTQATTEGLRAVQRVRPERVPEALRRSASTRSAQVARQRRLEGQRPPVRRVRERQARRVQERAGQPAGRRQPARRPPARAAVERVAHDRVPGLAQMDANLVRASGADAARERATRRRAARPRGSCVTAVRARRARVDIFCRCARIAADRAVDRLAGARRAPDEREVFLVDFAIVKLPRERAMRAVVLRDDHHAGRAAIEPVHDARPLASADAAEARRRGGAAR